MKTVATATILAVLILLQACASTSSHVVEGRGNRRSAPEKAEPSVMKPTAEETPAAVRAIEASIDRETAILATEAVIHVSKNYEMDISLSGDDTIKDVDPTGAVKSIGRGRCTAFVRNLKIVCDDSIVVKIADFGTQPFIKVTARGHCSHVIPSRSGQHEVKRAQAILIRNERVQYLENAGERIAAAFSGN